MLNVAVIGLGDISKIHIPAIQANPNAQLVAVCDIDEAMQRDYFLLPTPMQTIPVLSCRCFWKKEIYDQRQHLNEGK
ncbi:Gfo/Idh/MocA family oxidoreductase [Neobacillus soli]|uniref:Gfo/Idh/MocA family oxidoreductase n=1 Tax=Neobacillus soli TaxID=220688 RepID=UPI0008261431|nr:Gfo/Idh/MocA family oxidoreductase [Neobacillus soli]